MGDVKAKTMCYVSFPEFRILPILFVHYGALLCEEFEWLEKTAEISRRYHCFPHEMASEKRAQM